MAKAKTTSSVRPLTERPLDLVYYIFFAVHVLIAIGVDDLPLWPEQLTKFPGLKQIHGFLSAAIEDYTKKTNDPFMLATRGLVQREWEFAFLNAFMWMELLVWVPVFIIGMIGLQRDSKSVYPIILAYCAATLVTTSTVLWITLKAPSASDPNLDPVSKFYAVTDEGRRGILGPLIPFLLVPIVMFVDMLYRVTSLVKAGVKAQATLTAQNGKKHL